MPPKKPKRGRPAHPSPLAAVIHVKVTAAEHARLKEMAASERRTISEVVRHRVFSLDSL